MARQKRNITGATLIPPQAIARVYAREITSHVGAMIKDYRQLLTLYKEKQGQMAMDADTWISTDVERRLRRLGNKWAAAFEQFAEEKGPEMVNKVLKNTDLQLKTVLANFLATERWQLIAGTIPTQIRQVMKATVAENVSLIKSIATQYHERIAGAVYRAITGDGSLGNLRRDFVKYGKMSTRRAKLIASDQTHKAFTTIAARRMSQVGVSKFKWLHSHAVEKARPLHIKKWDGVSGPDNPNGLDGFIFTLDNPPVIDPKTGERGLPSRLPYCRCRMAPVLFEDE